MITLLQVLVYAVFLGLIFANPAYAYLDPGTGSLLLQALAAVFIGLSIFWRRILNAVRSMFTKKDTKEP